MSAPTEIALSRQGTTARSWGASGVGLRIVGLLIAHSKKKAGPSVVVAAHRSSPIFKLRPLSGFASTGTSVKMVFGMLANYGKAAIGVPKPGIKFPMHLMISLFVGGYTCEYLALGRKLFFVFVIPCPCCPTYLYTGRFPPPPPSVMLTTLCHHRCDSQPTEYHVAHDKAEIAAAKECYAKHGGGGGHH